ncbi:MAG: hypothetical protein HY787_20275 [Deltaproteobacteria bacterium]|nr:hypothetical protein [Deltaproteobacteria bacterium]
MKYIKPEDLFTHVLVNGATGTGKSNLLATWWFISCLFRVAKVLIDPGGLAEACFSYSKGKAHYLSAQTPLSLNPMRAKFLPHQILYILIESLNQLIERTTPNQPLTAKMRVIFQREFDWCVKNNRLRLDALRDRIAINREDAQTRDGILARLDLLLSDPIFRDILCGDSSIEIGTLIENQETLILDCSQFSRDQMIFIGTILISLIKSYFRFSRPKIYRPLLVFIDEMYNFLSPDIFIVLREGRKYRVGFIMATQDFSRMAEDLIRMILSHAGTLVAFKVGYREASLLQREFRNSTLEEIQFVEKYWCAFRTREDEGVVKVSKAIPVKPVEIKRESQPEVNLDEIKWFELHPV